LAGGGGWEGGGPAGLMRSYVVTQMSGFRE